MEYAQTVVGAYAVLTLIGQAMAVLLLAYIAYNRLSGSPSRVLAWISRNALWLMLIVALLATAGSLYFSDVALWTPCKKCWYQRIFMYPQVPLLLLALWKRDRGIAPYILTLSLIGAVMAAEHYTEQVMAAITPADPAVPCDTTGVSCASTPFFRFGYITIPVMAFTAFLLNIAGSWTMMRKR